jgi:hypothetical protein
MTTFTSSLPDDLFTRLNNVSSHLSLPKNKIIERALKIYLDQLARAEYIKSYRQAVGDENILTMAEEGMNDYFKQIENEAM